MQLYLYKGRANKIAKCEMHSCRNVRDTTGFRTLVPEGSRMAPLSRNSIFKMNTRDRFREKGPSAYYKICYKNALRLSRYNFRTVNAIDFLFSSLHLYFRVLHKLHSDVMRPDYPWGSKLPHLQVGASNSFQIQCVCRGVLSLLIFSVR